MDKATKAMGLDASLLSLPKGNLPAIIGSQSTRLLGRIKGMASIFDLSGSVAEIPICSVLVRPTAEIQ